MINALLLDARQERTAHKSPQTATPELPGFINQRLSGVHSRGTILFSEGQQSKGVYLVVSGSVKVWICSPHGKILILRIARVGDLLGVNSGLTGRPHEATAECLDHSRTIFIPRDEFISMYSGNEEMRKFVLRIFSRHVSEMIDSTRRNLLSETAKEKLASLLLKWADDLGLPDPKGVKVVLTFTHEEIAQMICTSRETISRLLSEFTRKGIITFIGKSLYLRNLSALRNIGQI